MPQDESSIEVKVGALVLLSLILFVGFVVVLGDFSLSDGFRIHADFDNAAGLKPGADVAISGINVGTVEEVDFEPGADDEDGSGVQVRTTLQIDEAYAKTVRSDSELFVSRQGVLGEPYIEIETRSFDAPAAEDGDVFEGTDLPRVDVIVSKATKLLDSLYEMIDDTDADAGKLVASAASLFENVDRALADNRDEIDQTVSGASTSADEASELLAALNTAVGDGQRLEALLADAGATASNARSISESVDGDIDPIVKDTRKATANARDVTDSADRLVTDNEDKIGRSIDNVHETTDNLARSSEGADQIVRRIEDGEGTVGQLLADREMYDDMKELIRSVKRRPWKLLWKE